MRQVLLLAAAALGALLGAGCAGAGTRSAAAVAAPDPCATPAATAPHDTVTVAFDRTVDPGPVVMRQLAASAGAADCAGHARDSGGYELLRRSDSLFAVPRRNGLPTVRFLPRLAPDARDQIDAGADLIVTRDARAVAYARSRPDLIAVPLAWDRIYTLVAPGPLAGTAPIAGLRDAVRADARVPEPPFWWTGDSLCAGGSGGMSQSRTRLLVPARDPVARDVGARIVAGAPGVVVAPADSAEFGRALGRGMDAGYIVALPHLRPAACPVAPWPAAWTVTPLIETRGYVILRAGAVRISTDADGLFRIVEPAP
jgi:hypothetical protein